MAAGDTALGQVKVDGVASVSANNRALVDIGANYAPLTPGAALDVSIGQLLAVNYLILTELRLLNQTLRDWTGASDPRIDLAALVLSG